MNYPKEFQKKYPMLEISLYRLVIFPKVEKKPEKIRKRYIVIKISSAEDIQRNDLIRAIRRASNSIDQNCYEEVKPWLTYFENNYGIIRYNHKKKEDVIAIVSRIKLLGANKDLLKIETLGISGTIKKARKKYIP